MRQRNLSPTRPAAAGRLTAALAFCALAAAAQPAPWYQWKSRLDGRVVCNQTSLGPGWERHDGPYSDARCQVRK